MSHNNDILFEERDIPFPTFCWRTIATYMIAYMICGLISQFYYRPVWNSGLFSQIMRPMDSPIVALGPAFQFINAFATAIILYPFRSIIINQKNGWVKLFLLVAGFSIFVPQAVSPGSLEGLIYTRLSLFEHLIGIPETLFFSFLFPFGLFQWYRAPHKAWNIISIMFVLAIVLMSILGYLASIGIITPP